MTDTPLNPIAKAARFQSLDVLRGFAALGILLMNIPSMGLSWDRALPPLPVQWNADWIAVVIQQLAFNGVMRGLFTLLFGAGMIVMLTRPDPAREEAAHKAYFARCFALMLLGFVNFAIFLWPGEILFSYGLCGLVLFLFRKADIRLLGMAAALSLILMPIGLHHTLSDRIAMLKLADAAVAAKDAGKKPGKEEAEALKTRDEKIREALSPQTQAKERAIRTSLKTLPEWSLEKWSEISLTGPFTVWFQLETLGSMLLGMILFRIGVLTGRRSTRFYALMAAGGLIPGLALRGAVEIVLWRNGYIPTADGVTLQLWLYQPARLCMMIGMLGLVMLLLKSGALGRLASPLAAVGRTALTTYIGQSVITSILFYGLGFYGRFGFAQLMGLCLLIWIAQCMMSMAWLRRFDMGPAEWLLRSLTYGRFTPIGRRNATGAMPTGEATV
ncbi:DUF418 domain-containing protein [Sphingobium rhizovicinum]|uniref:DUF418 domain-containing protein n=1 Tax=Sphingobium rhizovicinum TaxID=432308 RepID=A0ABV7NH44_9SPHN